MLTKILSTLGIFGFVGFAGLIGGWESTYHMATICTNEQNGIYTFTDKLGNDWEWEAEAGESFEVGNGYRLTMDDNHTPARFDDWIKKIEIGG